MEIEGLWELLVMIPMLIIKERSRTVNIKEEVPLQWDLLTIARDFNRRAVREFRGLPRRPSAFSQ